MKKTTIAIGMALLAAAGCKVKDPPPVTATWTENFERDVIGSNYYKTGGEYHIVDGTLSAKGGYNHPLWLRKKLPRDVQIELDAWSNSPAGDIKVELFGDGVSFDPDKGGYTASGYVLVMGGWNNSKSMIAKGNEHGKDLVERTGPKVELGRHYRWKIVRRGDSIDWFVDDMATPFLHYQDTRPLEGDDHAYFGFNNWESDSYFDNVVITPL
jgi:hypothetical protein